MNIEIYNPANGENIQAIKWNFDELKAWIAEGLKNYEGLVYTEDTIQLAKKDRADLNRLSKAIDDKRKEMKKMYLAPYEEFEKQAKELTGLIDAQSDNINLQVKAFEQAEKDAKLAEIKAIYAEEIGDFAELIPYEKLHDAKWLNKGVSIKAVREAIEIVVNKAKVAFSVIDAMGFDETTTNRVKGAFIRNLDLADAMAEKARIEDENRKLAEYAQKQAEAKAEAAEKPAEEEKAELKANIPQAEEKPAEVEIESLVTIDFRVTATKAQLDKLKQFLIENGIEYGKVE